MMPKYSALAKVVGDLLRTALRDGIESAQGAVEAKHTTIAGDVVTDTDFAVQDRLQTELIELLPDSTFIGEENFVPPDSLDDKPYWIVDPLDGTLNFSCDLPFFGASVALLVGGSPVVGAVYDYGSDTVYTAAANSGARANGTPFTWSAEMAARAPVGISSGYLAHCAADDAQSRAADIVGARYRIFGSQAVQLCWAAMGRLKMNINYEAKLWDDAAGWLICQEAGAAYAALGSDPLFPLLPGSPALAGENLLSVSGSPSLVTSYRDHRNKGL
jgi:myo-inositol-1(or 4)-monophosphatase